MESYQDAAELLNFNNIDMVAPAARVWNFGGRPQATFCTWLRGLKMPVVSNAAYSSA